MQDCRVVVLIDRANTGKAENWRYREGKTRKMYHMNVGDRRANRQSQYRQIRVQDLGRKSLWRWTGGQKNLKIEPMKEKQNVGDREGKIQKMHECRFRRNNRFSYYRQSRMQEIGRKRLRRCRNVGLGEIQIEPLQAKQDVGDREEKTQKMQECRVRRNNRLSHYRQSRMQEIERKRLRRCRNVGLGGIQIEPLQANQDVGDREDKTQKMHECRVRRNNRLGHYRECRMQERGKDSEDTGMQGQEE